MFITINQIIHCTQLLYLLTAAVWLGSLPFVKRTSSSSRYRPRFNKPSSSRLVSISSWFSLHTRLVQSIRVPRYLPHSARRSRTRGLRRWPQHLGAAILRNLDNFPSLKQNHALIMTALIVSCGIPSTPAS